MSGAAVAPSYELDRVPAWQMYLGLFVCALAVRLACFTGLIASDDLDYFEYARQIAEGQYTPVPSHWAVRFGVIVPVGVIYRIFGVSEWTTVAFPLAASALSVVLLALVTRTLLGTRAAIVAALLLATFPLHIRWASILVPEPILGFHALVAVFTHVRLRARRPIVAGLLTGVFIGFAYLTKEPAAFIGAALFLEAAITRRFTQAAAIAAGLLSVVAVEHTYYVATTGDWLFRLHSIAEHNTSVPQSNHPEGHAVPFDLYYRLFKAYPRQMLIPNEHFGLHSLVAVIGTAVAAVRFRRDRRVWLLLLWAGVPWLYMNFGSSSLTRYITVPPSARYLDFVYPPLFVLTAWLAVDLASTSRRTARWFMCGLAVTLVSGFVWGYAMRATAFRTGDAAVLRRIVERFSPADIDRVCVRVEAPPRERWEQTLYIASRGALQPCHEQEGVVVGADQFGLPYVVSSPVTTDVKRAPPPHGTR
jgi:4-amino-4-deoxy-L-arabinose transferase-like glycosyltransferase